MGVKCINAINIIVKLLYANTYISLCKSYLNTYYNVVCYKKLIKKYDIL